MLPTEPCAPAPFHRTTSSADCPIRKRVVAERARDERRGLRVSEARARMEQVQRNGYSGAENVVAGALERDAGSRGFLVVAVEGIHVGVVVGIRGVGVLNIQIAVVGSVLVAVVAEVVGDGIPRGVIGDAIGAVMRMKDTYAWIRRLAQRANVISQRRGVAFRISLCTGLVLAGLCRGLAVFSLWDVGEGLKGGDSAVVLLDYCCAQVGRLPREFNSTFIVTEQCGRMVIDIRTWQNVVLIEHWPGTTVFNGACRMIHIVHDPALGVLVVLLLLEKAVSASKTDSRL